MYKKSTAIVITVVENKSEEDATITVPNPIYSWLAIDSFALLKVGFLEKRAICNSNNTVNTIEVPADLAKDFGLADGMITNVIIKDNKLCLGPVIGVFVSNGSIRLANLQKPGFRLTELFGANNDANTILYYFSVNDVDFIDHKILGTYYNEKNGKWENRSVSLPPVLSARGGGAVKNQ